MDCSSGQEDVANGPQARARTCTHRDDERDVRAVVLLGGREQPHGEHGRDCDEIEQRDEREVEGEAVLRQPQPQRKVEAEVDGEEVLLRGGGGMRGAGVILRRLRSPGSPAATLTTSAIHVGSDGMYATTMYKMQDTPEKNAWETSMIWPKLVLAYRYERMRLAKPRSLGLTAPGGTSIAFRPSALPRLSRRSSITASGTTAKKMATTARAAECGVGPALGLHGALTAKKHGYFPSLLEPVADEPHVGVVRVWCLDSGEVDEKAS